MKSVLEIVTILIFLFCLTMLERMDKSCCNDMPPPAYHPINQQKNSPVNNLAAMELGSAISEPKASKYPIQQHTHAIVTSVK